jgi:hypothetical protein
MGKSKKEVKGQDGTASLEGIMKSLNDMKKESARSGKETDSDGVKPRPSG